MPVTSRFWVWYSFWMYFPINDLNKFKKKYGDYYKKLVFLDSYRFLQKGLSDIAKSLHSDDLKILKEHFETEALKEKSIYFSSKLNMSHY